MSRWGKKTHFPSRYNNKRPRCIATFGWKMDLVEWLLSSDVNKVNCRLCLKCKGKSTEADKDILEEARRHVLARLL